MTTQTISESQPNDLALLGEVQSATMKMHDYAKCFERLHPDSVARISIHQAFIEAENEARRIRQLISKNSEERKTANFLIRVAVNYAKGRIS